MPQVPRDCSAVKHARDAAHERTHFRDIDEQRNWMNRQKVYKIQKKKQYEEKVKPKWWGDPSFALAQVPRSTKVVYELVIVDCVDDNMFR